MEEVDEVALSLRQAVATEINDIVDPLRFRIARLQAALEGTTATLEVVIELLRLSAKNESIDRVVEDYWRSKSKAPIPSPLLIADEE